MDGNIVGQEIPSIDVPRAEKNLGGQEWQSIWS